MRRTLFHNIVLLLGGVFAGCSPITGPWKDDAAGFAVNLYNGIRSNHLHENLIFSPASISLLLGMVRMGAKGKALHQIREALKLQENEEGEEFSKLKALSSAITERKQEFAFDLANVLYLQEGFTVKETYLHSNREYFQSAIKLVNFQDSKASAKAISQWVESQTNGKIRNLFSSEDFSPLTRLVLVNVLYFKGEWKYKFNPKTTSLMTFTKKDNSTAKIPMMHLRLRTKFGYFSDKNLSYQVLELLYKGDEFCLLLILPEIKVDIEEVEKLISVQLIKEWLTEMTEQEVEVSLPRFKLEQKLDFKKSLHTLNVTEIFNQGCDLSGITDSAEIHVSAIIQKVCFETNEDGSEAAASSGVNVAAIMSMSHFQFVADHPFIFILKHEPSGSILFMGKLTNPDIQTSRGRDIESL